MPPTSPPEDRAARMRVARWIWAHFQCRPEPDECDQVEFAAVLGVSASIITQAKKAAKGIVEDFSVSSELLFRLRRALRADLNKMLDRDPKPADNDEMGSRLGALWSDNPIVLERRQNKAAGEPTPKRRRHATARG